MLVVYMSALFPCITTFMLSLIFKQSLGQNKILQCLPINNWGTISFIKTQKVIIWNVSVTVGKTCEKYIVIDDMWKMSSFGISTFTGFTFFGVLYYVYWFYYLEKMDYLQPSWENIRDTEMQKLNSLSENELLSEFLLRRTLCFLSPQHLYRVKTKPV